MPKTADNAKFDLCGELGHDDDDFPTLARADAFGFTCAGCGGCCRGRDDIILSGYDLYRLSTRLGVPPQTVINGYCALYTGAASGLPVVRLRPDGVSGNCPFYLNRRCTVHEARPLVCALYPLGQSITKEGAIEYFYQDLSCGNPLPGNTLQDTLAASGILEREAIDVRWAMFNLALGKWVRAAAPGLKPLTRKVVQRRIAHALYLDYAPGADYEAQWDANLADLMPRLDELLGTADKPAFITKD